MIRRVLWLAPIAALAASTASAQYRAEISGFGGYTFADGVTFAGVEVPETGQIFNSIEPTNAVSWGVELGIFMNENAQVGALFDRHQSSLRASGPATRLEVADMNVDNYHVVFTFNFGDMDDTARPYVQGGIGATSYGSFSVEDREINGETRFSTTWGAGIKVYPGDVFGLRLGVRWTPTYIKSDPAGWWCDPFWGCYVASNAQFSNQFEFNGGISLRF